VAPRGRTAESPLRPSLGRRSPKPASTSNLLAQWGLLTLTNLQTGYPYAARKPKLLENVHITGTLTNLANDRTLTDDSRTVSKDVHVTDNGDGTLTILVLATGNFTLYGADGKAIARNPGQVRFELLVDHGGTPGDPSDDVELAFTLVKESTGRSEDFCAAAVAALT
jgi:hypothetical protein